jgi:hypothetical protein
MGPALACFGVRYRARPDSISKRAPSTTFALSGCAGRFGENRGAPDPCVPTSAQRFHEPLHVFERSRSDVMRRRIAGEVPLLQEVDIGSSAEITLSVRLRGTYQHAEETAAFSFVNRWRDRRQLAPRVGSDRDIFRDNLGDSRVPASRSLAYT